jgi:hypothetical protein
MNMRKLDLPMGNGRATNLKIRKTNDMTVTGAQSKITACLLTWADVSTALHRFGGVEYRLGQREIGHIHGDYLLDIPFPTKVRTEILAQGLAEPHHVLPDSGWVSLYLHRSEDVQKAIDLLQLSYELAVKQRQLRDKGK